MVLALIFVRIRENIGYIAPLGMEIKAPNSRPVTKIFHESATGLEKHSTIGSRMGAVKDVGHSL